MPDEPPALTANQIVGYNLKRARLAFGLDQTQARARLKPYGLDLSKNVYSAAERSYDGKRVRQFTGDEILAMSLAFGVPPAYFLLPPGVEDRPPGAVLTSGKVDVSWPQLVDALEGGEMRAAYDQRLMELPPDERPMRAYKESEIRQYLDVADMARRHREERDG